MRYSSVSTWASQGLFPSVQFAYRKCHSTYTAMTRVLSDILMALELDHGKIAALALLDLSAAFDAVNHSILMRRFCEPCGISGTVLTWISLYLTDHQHTIQQSVCLSFRDTFIAGVHQVKCAAGLRPHVLSVCLYTAILVPLIADHSLHSQLYIDNSKLWLVVIVWCQLALS